jgi:hypothetical protein
MCVVHVDDAEVSSKRVKTEDGNHAVQQSVVPLETLNSQLADRAVSLCVKRLVPPSTLQTEEFRDFIAVLNPRVTVPSAPTIRRRILDKAADMRVLVRHAPCRRDQD